MLRSNLVAESADAVVTEGVRAVDGDLLVVHPSRETVRTLVETLRGLDAPPQVRLLVAERPVKDLMNDFLLASVSADLIQTEALAVKTHGEASETALFVTEDAVVSLVGGGSKAAGLTTTDEAFVDAAGAYHDDRWADATPFTLRTPPLSEVRETLAAEIGERTASDFDRVLDSLGAARGDGEGLDEVTISLLVAARNRELLYDISKWGEDVGLASKATFSRSKTRLEEKGLIDTEKVPIDVGRPRLRLKLGDDRLADADPDELAGVAQRLLAT